MELVIADQIRLSTTPDGATWAKGWGGYAQFEAYRGDFERVNVACRLEPVACVDMNAIRCDGPSVSFVGMPSYVGAAQYFRAAAAVGRRIREAYQPKAAYLLRMPSQMGCLFMKHLIKKGHPFGVVVVADPFKDFERKSCGHPAWRLLQWRYTKALHSACRNAAAVAYVTAGSLQRQYPPGDGFVTDFSDIVLTDDWYVSNGRTFPEIPGRRWNLLHVGAFNQLYKGQDTLLNAVARLRDGGVSLRMTFAGDGRYRQKIQQMADALRLEDTVSFVGEVPYGVSIRSLLDAADLFILPSRTEGLPRALLEAMARAMPCIATDVGGVPELLDRTSLVPPDRADLLSERILSVLSRPDTLTEMSARNLSTAQRYHWTQMAPRRRGFLNHLRLTTEAWLRLQGAASA